MAQNASGQIVPNGPSTAWHVTGQQESFQPGPAGQVTQGVKIMFTTAMGNQGSVWLPEAQYNPNNVRAAIAAKAQLLDQVGQLHSQG